MKNVVRRDWREDIDSEAYAVLAMAEEVWRGGVYRASTFILAPRIVPTYQARREAYEKLAREMEQRVYVRQAGKGGFYMHRFGMPHVGWVRDLRR